MSTLVIHPKDNSTLFLEAVYAQIEEKTVIRSGQSKIDLMEMISKHDRIIMLGHGSPNGLLSMGLFPGAGLYIVDEEMATLLKEKQNSVFIWCYAAQFIKRHELHGWYSDMFVSEVGEGLSVGMRGIDQETVNSSNEAFGTLAGQYIHFTDPKEICENVKRDYAKIALNNPCARYNVKRLGYNTVFRNTDDHI